MASTSLGDLTQRDLPQREQVFDGEEVVQRRLDVLARVDLAGAEALDQRLGGEVDQHHLVGLAEHGVGDRLADAGAGQLGDLVVQRLEVLDVDGREDVDPRRQHVANVLEALLVLDAGGVGVRELVDQRQIGITPQQRRQVHLLELGAAVGNLAPGNRLQALGKRRGLGPAVGLHVPDRDVAASVLFGVAFLQHPVRLSNTGGHSDEDLVVSARAGQAPSRLWMTRSMSLIPMKGAIRPPSP